MSDKISDDHPSPTGNTNTALDNPEKTMDSEKQALRTKDADAALEFLYAEETTLMTDVDEKALVRKIDWRIVPLMCRSSDIKRQVAIQLNKAKSQGLVTTSNISTRHWSIMPTLWASGRIQKYLPTNSPNSRLSST